MPTSIPVYPFDPTGSAATNRITGETKILAAPNWRNYFFIIPSAAPFFKDGLVLVHYPSNRTLVEGVDYVCTHLFYDATKACGREIYGSISFYDKTLTGVVSMTYQTLGGDWTLDETRIQELLSNELANPRITTWDSIVDLPYQFPVIDHEWDLTDMVGASQVVQKLDDIRDAIEAAATGATDSHLNDFNNPHHVTKAQVGLGNVENYGIADSAAAVAGTSNTAYMTPQRVREAILAQAGNSLSSHLADQNNPHNVTKAQVGLANVENYAVASGSEAASGTRNDLYLTPAALNAALVQRVDMVIGPHINSQSNPHNVSKAQVGLGNVQNYPMASSTMAQAGADNASYMSPLRVREAIESMLGNNFNAHVNNTNNPHNVNKAQIGLSNVQNLPLASDAAAIAGQDDSGYMTPRTTALLVSALGGGGGGGGGDSAHALRTDNPHQVTAAQVGAYTKSEIDQLLLSKLSTTGTAANAARLQGLTASDILSQARSRFILPAVNTPDGGTPAPSWTMLGTYTPPTVIDYDNPPADVVFFYGGGDARYAESVPLFLIKVNLFEDVFMDVEQLAGQPADIEFGYVRDLATQNVVFYSKNPPDRSAISLMPISDPSNGIGTTQPPLNAPPSGFTSAQVFTYRAAATNADATPGDVTYGHNPFTAGDSDTDSAVVEINVVDDTVNAEIVESDAVDLFDELHDYVPMSVYGNRSRNAEEQDLLNWDWDSEDTAIRHDPMGQTLIGLRQTNRYTSYSFEVELVSGDSADMGLGVLAAFRRINGKDYGIYAMRTPGGLVLESNSESLPGGDIYRLFTVGYNLFQDDAKDFGSTNAGLVWGDGTVDEDRGVVGPYSSTAPGVGWDANMFCRIRVEREGDILTIMTTQLGSTDYSGGAEVTIDLSQHPELRVFREPTSVGVVKYRQGSSWFKILEAPDLRRPYIRLEKTASNRDISTIHRWNGYTWLSQPLKLDQSFVKPGRIIYSPINNRLFRAMRSGVLKPMPMEAFTSSDVTVLTP